MIVYWITDSPPLSLWLSLTPSNQSKGTQRNLQEPAHIRPESSSSSSQEPTAGKAAARPTADSHSDQSDTQRIPEGSSDNFRRETTRKVSTSA